MKLAKKNETLHNNSIFMCSYCEIMIKLANSRQTEST